MQITFRFKFEQQPNTTLDKIILKNNRIKLISQLSRNKYANKSTLYFVYFLNKIIFYEFLSINMHMIMI